MTLASELDLPSFDYTDPSFKGERLHEAMSELRAQAWLARGPFDTYIVLDREAGELFLRSRKAIFPGMKIAEIFGVTEGPLYEQMRRNILHVNGPDHTRLRGLLNPALSARAVERYRPALRRFLADLFAAVTTAPNAGAPDDQGAQRDGRNGPRGDRLVRCEFVEAFAKPYPSLTIANVMGAPLADASRLHYWSNWIQRQFDAVSMATERDGIERAVEEFYEYAEALVAARRKDPGDDLISRLIAATPPEGTDRASSADGDEAPTPRGALSDVECVNLVFNVLVGGVDTTQSQLAHAIRLLAEHPEQWKLLAQDPSLAPNAVDEALRYEPITPFTARITTEEVDFRDVSFPEGTVVMVCAFSGNRDLGEDAGDVDAFDLTIDRGRARPLTFGAGVHYCVGANLARLELEEALAFLAPRMPGLALDGEPEYQSITGIYGLAKLPISFMA
jgi:cytochrome P450